MKHHYNPKTREPDDLLLDCPALFDEFDRPLRQSCVSSGNSRNFETIHLKAQIMDSSLNTMTLDDCPKSDRVVRNCWDIAGLDEPIYRIARADYMLEDIEGKINTLVRPCEETQGDENENPLRMELFQIGAQKAMAIHGIMSDFYTQSWSSSIVPWNTFANGYDKVRIKSTPRRLLDRLMDTANRNYSLSYYIGRVEYLNDEDLERAIKQTDLTQSFLFNGQGLIESVMRLCSTLSSEDEIRLVFFRTEDTLGNFGKRYPLRGPDGCLCSHPFDWEGVLTDYELCPSNQSGHSRLRGHLDKYIDKEAE